MPSHIVNSWNEWDNLTEVMVGTMDGKVIDAPQEPAIRLKFSNYNKYQHPITYSNDDQVAAAKECVDEYVTLLKKQGINVVRPTSRDLNRTNLPAITTPTFSTPSENGITCPRDVFTVYGNHIIEAPMSWRTRYFENQCYRDLMMDYMRRDPRLHWEVAPKPLLTDKSYDGSNLTLDRHEEIMFDAADFRRFGRDVFAQNAHTTNLAGIDWVRRTLARDGLRVHQLEWESTDLHPVTSFSHLDAKITPVDEDMLLWTRKEAPTEKQLNLFKENDWKIIEIGDRQQCTSINDQTGPGIHLNVLTISKSVVIVEAGETNMIKTLREEGVDVIPLKFAPCYRYGGGLNCFTLDVCRDGSMKNYFPTLDHLEESNKMNIDVSSAAADDELPSKRPRLERRVSVNFD
jgi:glycine amidinotransferase